MVYNLLHISAMVLAFPSFLEGLKHIAQGSFHSSSLLSTLVFRVEIRSVEATTLVSAADLF